jgi:uncharacterized membrane protein YraQ (UPF0718 family)
MNTSPITTWEGAEAYFTFGPNSLGLYVIFALAVALFIGFVARMIVHENHNFARTRELHTRMRELRASYADPSLAGNNGQNPDNHGGQPNRSMQEREGVLQSAEEH